MDDPVAPSPSPLSPNLLFHETYTQPVEVADTMELSLSFLLSLLEEEGGIPPTWSSPSDSPMLSKVPRFASFLLVLA